MQLKDLSPSQHTYLMENWQLHDQKHFAMRFHCHVSDISKMCSLLGFQRYYSWTEYELEILKTSTLQEALKMLPRRKPQQIKQKLKELENEV